MRKHILLRALCGLTFLIFLCPFYQACSDNDLKRYGIEATMPKVKEKEPLVKQANDSIFLEKKRSSTYTAYEAIDDMFSITGSINYLNLPFVIILICSAFQFFYSFKNRYGTVRFLGFINIITVILYLGVQAFFHILEEITQIKYGCYLFLINTIAILVLSKKLTDDAV